MEADWENTEIYKEKNKVLSLSSLGDNQDSRNAHVCFYLSTQICEQ